MIAFFLFAVPPMIAANSPPEVTNVYAFQRPDASKLVDITYDLLDADGDTCIITVLASDDGGLTWTLPITSVSGAVGGGIQPGTGKHIIWNPSVDLPEISGTQFRIRVIANDGHAPSGMAFIPADEYDMGDHHDGMGNALPVHTVFIDAYHIDIYEVTNEQYCIYLNSAIGQGLIEVKSGVVYKKGGSEPYCDTTQNQPFTRITWNGSSFGVVSGKEEHPMVKVSWYGAVAFANWRSAQKGLIPCYNLETWECDFGAGGYRLPTEAEWEKAARGGEYNPYYRYPWGDTLDGSKANYWNSGDPYEGGGGFPETTPVGYYDGNQIPPGVDMANGYGIYDMAGNVSEWCNDWFDPYYYGSSPYNNPKGSSSSPYSSRVRRGGSYGSGTEELRCAGRGHGIPGHSYVYVGFRLALE